MTPRYASHRFCLHHEPTAILQGMLFRRLGTSGLQVPIISLGGWLTYGRTVNGEPPPSGLQWLSDTIAGDLVKDIIKYAFEAGIN
jgi:aryl-alcohol dehydrogenase-like predicted oxidoreductase